jgi:prepilin-type processing-associated H-X9-DG protein
MYAQANDEQVPLGVSTATAYPDIEHDGNGEGEDGYFTNRNHYIWAGGRPSVAGGPFLLAGLVKSGSAKIFYCPAESHGKEFKFNTLQNPWIDFDPSKPLPQGNTTRISYATRPVIGVYWPGGGLYPSDMPQLVQLKNKAIVAELPQVPPANHGSGSSTFINVLYGDGSVRPCFVSKYKEPLDRYLSTPKDVPPGGYGSGNSVVYRSSSEAAISNDPTKVTIWGELDKN